MIKHFIFAMSLLGFWYPFPILAGHLSDNKITKGEAEHVLCGINVYKTKIEKVIAAFGKPTTIETFMSKKGDSNYEPGSGINIYTWNRSGSKMRLRSWFTTDEKTGKIVKGDVFEIDVWGGKAKKEIGVTGKGIALGDSLLKVLKTYEKPTSQEKNPSNKISNYFIRWEDGAHLDVDFDQNGRINHIQLSTANEY